MFGMLREFFNDRRDLRIFLKNLEVAGQQMQKRVELVEAFKASVKLRVEDLQKEGKADLAVQLRDFSHGLTFKSLLPGETNVDLSAITDEAFAEVERFLEVDHNPAVREEIRRLAPKLG